MKRIYKHLYNNVRVTPRVTKSRAIKCYFCFISNDTNKYVFLENDATYILSKLSDEELLKLLNEFPKRAEYDMDDIVNVSGALKKKKNELEYAKKGKYLLILNSVFST